MPLADAKTKKILVIDDDKNYLGIITRKLTSEGFQVIAAPSSVEIKPKIESINPDLIVLDLVMPGIGGLELLRHLQADGLSSVPVILVTGFDRYDKAATEELMRAEPNVVDYMVKPFHLTIFALRVHQILKTMPAVVANPEGGSTGQ